MQSFNCNACARPLKLFDDSSHSSGHLKSYFTECKHIFCVRCAQRSRTHCYICRRPTRFLEIRKEMPKHLRMFFEPFPKVFEVLKNIAEFQSSQENYTAQKLYDIYKRIAEKDAQIKRKCHELKKTEESLGRRTRYLQFISRKVTDFE